MASATAARQPAPRLASTELSAQAERDAAAQDDGIINPTVVIEVPESPAVGIPPDAKRVQARVGITVDRMTYGRRIDRQVMTDERGEPVLDRDGNEIIVETPGDIRYFDFEEGRLYEMDVNLYRHMSSRGLISEVVSAI